MWALWNTCKVHMINQLKVTNIEFYSDETALVTVENEHSAVDVFCHICEYSIGDKVNNLLKVLDANVRAAYLADWPVEMIAEASKERIEKTGPYSYIGCGKVIDENEGVIEVQGFLIEFGDLPCQGSVEFEIDRLDLW
ncbi:hypothetical protein H5154_16120 [Pseudoalteromonas sp. SR44-5]|nr:MULTISPECIES: hypothetical protein [unclassified Pseudoalteromonas]MBB1458452.1 hypothetical protein [Pseudoalteromonas sp. SG41-8]MBB1469916.1 hypothetical protein [Pseudoalteromonas sp. SG41-5]MBB1334647.1 hypothetical protein [Pseudoalteromonas sp. SR41-6]MBB1367910.1 hypothetical protein [Pseudoalteromonas sp. SR44-5]MBB1418948.1 hypothetical protein [Pseudoalteromonas sp. SG44-1]